MMSQSILLEIVFFIPYPVSRSANPRSTPGRRRKFSGDRTGQHGIRQMAAMLSGGRPMQDVVIVNPSHR
jgi:hypothetical protein